MEHKHFEVEAFKPFSESLIWQLNRDYYQNTGIEAWSEGVVPHHMTSNSMVGKTYAELILGFLKDLAAKGKTEETVYILELGAGHGRLAFHVLKHLERLKALLHLELPPYCYVLSDIVEDNLTFFLHHPQFQPYFEQGILDLAYFDAVKSEELHLRYSNIDICSKSLDQPILAIANYFFDSLPNDLFLIKNHVISSCSIALESIEDPKTLNTADLLENLELVYFKEPLEQPFYSQAFLNEMLDDYKDLVTDSHLFFPQKGLQCLSNIQALSNMGLMLLSMDKGFYDIMEMDKKAVPDFITHGSFSLWVNFHALGAFCDKQGGKVMFPSYSSFYLQMGCLMFLPEGESYTETNTAYQRFVNDFGPDDFTGIKRSIYRVSSQLSLPELIGLVRLSNYDSTFFIKLLPRFKQLCKQVTREERQRFGETMHQVWGVYFSINESLDFAYELGGIFYDLGFYKDALVYFEHSITQFGQKGDIYYNKALCYYQLREDQLFAKTVKEAKKAFPGLQMLDHLDSLDMGAV